VREQRGFTLIELMISLVLFSLAVAGILSVAVSMTAGFRTQRQVVQAEVAARAPIDFISDAIRGASPGVSTSNIVDVETCASGAVKITDSSTGPDKLEVVFASGGIYGWTTTVFDATSTSIGVSDASQLAVGDYIVVANSAFTQGHLARITAISTNTLSIAAANCAGGASPNIPTYPIHSLFVRAQRAEFSVANDADGIPTLYLDPDGPRGSRTAEPLAEGIEDLQVAIGIDANTDGSLSEVGLAANDDEWTGNYAGDTLPVGTKIRAVRVTLVARTTKPLLNGPVIGNRPTAENHAGTSPNSDTYRRRVLKSTVEIRNLGGSP
jgi:prepilin-type N-terminal cleavage/methylation domain-containing protein